VDPVPMNIGITHFSAAFSSVLFLLKEKAPKSSSKMRIAHISIIFLGVRESPSSISTPPCTRPD